jgi:hypothetical protein
MLKLLYAGNCCASFMLVQVFFFHMKSHLCASVSHSDGPLSLCVVCVCVCVVMTEADIFVQKRPSEVYTLIDIMT